MDESLKLIFNRRERKFPLTQDRWDGVAECAASYLPTQKYDGVHSITCIRTTYLDTPRLDSYREYLECRPIRKKIRIRQYGYDGVFEERCWVEIKIKRYAETLKRRFCCSNGGVVALLAGEDIIEEVLRPSAAADKEWLHYGGNQWNERHATLTKISKRNVAQLVPRRVLQLARGITLGL